MSDGHYKNLFTNESIAMTKGNNMKMKIDWKIVGESLIELAGERDDLNTLADSQRELIDSLNNENDNLKQGLTRTQDHLDDMTVENARLEEENQELRRGQGRWPEKSGEVLIDNTDYVPRVISAEELRVGQVAVIHDEERNSVVGGLVSRVENGGGIMRFKGHSETIFDLDLSEVDTIVLLNEALTGADKVRASRPGTVWIDSAGQHWQWDGEKIRLCFGENKQFIGGPVEPHESDWELSDLSLIAEP